MLDSVDNAAQTGDKFDEFTDVATASAGETAVWDTYRALRDESLAQGQQGLAATQAADDDAALVAYRATLEPFSAMRTQLDVLQDEFYEPQLGRFDDEVADAANDARRTQWLALAVAVIFGGALAWSVAQAITSRVHTRRRRARRRSSEGLRVRRHRHPRAGRRAARRRGAVGVGGVRRGLGERADAGVGGGGVDRVVLGDRG